MHTAFYLYFEVLWGNPAAQRRAISRTRYGSDDWTQCMTSLESDCFDSGSGRLRSATFAMAGTSRAGMDVRAAPAFRGAFSVEPAGTDVYGRFLPPCRGRTH